MSRGEKLIVLCKKGSKTDSFGSKTDSFAGVEEDRKRSTESREIYTIPLHSTPVLLYVMYHYSTYIYIPLHEATSAFVSFSESCLEWLQHLNPS